MKRRWSVWCEPGPTEVFKYIFLCNKFLIACTWDIILTLLILIIQNAVRFETSECFQNVNGRRTATYRVQTATAASWSILAFFHMWDYFCATAPQWGRAFSFTRFLDHTQRRTTFGRTALDEWSARRRPLPDNTNNNHKGQTSMPSAGFEPTIPASERPQNYALECAATGIGSYTGLL
jgi:hypothetical protein